MGAQLRHSLPCGPHGIAWHVRWLRLWAQLRRALAGRMVHPGPRSRLLRCPPVTRVPALILYMTQDRWRPKKEAAPIEEPDLEPSMQDEAGEEK